MHQLIGKKLVIILWTSAISKLLAGLRGPTPTKIVYEILNPMIILARFQIPDQDSSPKISVQAGARWLRN